MTFDQTDHLTRIALQYCPAMKTFFEIMTAAEQYLDTSMPGKRNVIQVNFGRLHDPASLETKMVVVIRLNGELFYRQEEGFSESIDLEFRFAKDQKWLQHMNEWFKRIMIQFFTAGVFSMCRVHINKETNKYEEQDIETL
jgi:hypothetical protein